MECNQQKKTRHLIYTHTHMHTHTHTHTHTHARAYNLLTPSPTLAPQTQHSIHTHTQHIGTITQVGDTSTELYTQLHMLQWESMLVSVLLKT